MTTRLVILAVINAYVMCRVVMCIARMLVLPGGRPLRLLNLRDETAAYIEIWVRRIAVVAVFGIATAEVAHLLGLHRAGYAALVRIVMLIVHLFVVIILLQCRHAVADWICAPQPRGAFALVRNRLADLWHVGAIFLVMALWVVWAMRVQNGYALVLQFFLATLAVLVAARLAGIVALGGLDRIFRISPEFAARFPALEGRANRYFPVLRGAVSTVIGVVTLLVLLEVWGIDALRWFESGHVGGRLLSSLVTVAIAGAIALVIWESVNAAIERHHGPARPRGALFPHDAPAYVAADVAHRAAGRDPDGGRAYGAQRDRCQHRALAGGRRHRRSGDRIRLAEAGAGPDHGLFLLLENAIQVGDFVTVSACQAGREPVDPHHSAARQRRLVHIIPFSAVTSVTNTNRGIGNASISINVAYKEDTDRVGEVLKNIAAELRQDPDFKLLIRGDLALWGVDKVDGRACHHSRPDRMHRCRPLEGAARIQPTHEEALPGIGYRDRGADVDDGRTAPGSGARRHALASGRLEVASGSGRSNHARAVGWRTERISAALRCRSTGRPRRRISTALRSRSRASTQRSPPTAAPPT